MNNIKEFLRNYGRYSRNTVERYILHSHIIILRAVSFAVLSIVIFSLSIKICYAQGDDPVSVDVIPLNFSSPVGRISTVQIILRDAFGQVVAAPKALEFTLEVVGPSGRLEKYQVPMSPGLISATFGILISEAGIFHLRAIQPELLEGAGIVVGVPKSRWAPLSGMNFTFAAGSTFSSGAEVPASQARDFQASANASEDIRISANSSPPTPDPLPPTASPTAGFLGDQEVANKSLVRIFVKPDRIIRADGVDKAIVTAIANNASSDISILFHVSLGEITPNPITIPLGGTTAEAVLKSDTIGASQIKIVRVDPKTSIEIDGKSSITFGPTITHLQVDASPPGINLLDQAELVGKLTDPTGILVATDIPRTLSFTIRDGRGGISPLDVTFPAGQAVARATFQPSLPGEVIISAATPNLLSREASVVVSTPVVEIALSFLGGFIGGLISFSLNRNKKKRMIMIGLITGPVLSWLAIIGAVEMNNIGYTSARFLFVNVVSIVIISIVGGFGGPGVLRMVLKRFGIEWAQ